MLAARPRAALQFTHGVRNDFAFIIQQAVFRGFTLNPVEISG